jgi:hypothetical protein
MPLRGPLRGASAFMGFTSQATYRRREARLSRRCHGLVAQPGRRFVIPGHHGWSDRRSLEHTLRLLDDSRDSPDR